jgi:hypothetical protein
MRLAGVLLAVAVTGCGDDGGGDGGMRVDSGGGMDGGGPRDGGGDAGFDAAAFDGCIPQIEICGDRMDQNCDGMETPCGDTDMDGIMACRAGDDLTRCDCDDARMDVRPPFGMVAGAPEICDGRDNDCNMRIDESAMCCEGCASLDDRMRADLCLEDGTCDCTTEDGVGACPTARLCCGDGCVDTQTDFMNCGFCGTVCTTQADRCVGGDCRCGTGPACDKVVRCVAGSCSG